MLGVLKQRKLLLSRSRIIVLICSGSDGAHFLRSGLAVGLGGAGRRLSRA